MTITHFLLLTFALSLSGFVGVWLLPSAHSPETATGLPLWLLMVWGPTLAASILAGLRGELTSLLSRSLQLASVPGAAWMLALSPLLLVLLLRPWAADAAQPLDLRMALLMVLFNLALGPLGEELGFRGVLQAKLGQRVGWLEASLLVGVVWFAWHLPLWAIDSPQSHIALPVFGLHCLLYAIMLGGVYTLSRGSLLPVVALHLTVNLASNLALFVGFREANAWFVASLGPYAVLAVATIACVYLRTGQLGLRTVGTFLAQH